MKLNPNLTHRLACAGSRQSIDACWNEHVEEAIDAVEATKVTIFVVLFAVRNTFVNRSKKVRQTGVDFDDNDLSKDGENSLSQSIFDDPNSSRTREFIAPTDQIDTQLLFACLQR